MQLIILFQKKAQGYCLTLRVTPLKGLHGI
jgi:hypothetical protein